MSHTIIGTSDDREGYWGQYPPLRLYLGPDGRLALQPVIRVTNCSSNDMGMNVYISQWKYIPYLTSIHALSPYELSHTIIPVTCVYNWFNNRYNHVICTSSFIIFILYNHIDIQPNLLSKLLLSHPLIILLLIV